MNIKFIYFTLFIWFLFGCKSQSRQDYLSTKGSQNVDSLQLLINFPFKIKSASWELQTMNNENGSVPGPNDYKLFADVEFNISDSNIVDSFFKKMANDPARNIYLDSSSIRGWYNQELKKVFYQEGNYIKVKGNAYKIKSGALKTMFQYGWIVRYGSRNIFFIMNTI